MIFPFSVIYNFVDIFPTNFLSPPPSLSQLKGKLDGGREILLGVSQMELLRKSVSWFTLKTLGRSLKIDAQDLGEKTE